MMPGPIQILVILTVILLIAHLPLAIVAIVLAADRLRSEKLTNAILLSIFVPIIGPIIVLSCKLNG